MKKILRKVWELIRCMGTHDWELLAKLPERTYPNPHFPELTLTTIPANIWICKKCNRKIKLGDGIRPNISNILGK
jgi:hypothetical protein